MTHAVNETLLLLLSPFLFMSLFLFISFPLIRPFLPISISYSLAPFSIYALLDACIWIKRSNCTIACSAFTLVDMTTGISFVSLHYDDTSPLIILFHQSDRMTDNFRTVCCWLVQCSLLHALGWKIKWSQKPNDKHITLHIVYLDTKHLITKWYCVHYYFICSRL